jgi:predicted alpha/beta superfamily hydrolase
VLYLSDGQNVFANVRSRRPTWRADEIAGALVARGDIVPLAIVGIEHSGPVRRWTDYLPYADPRNRRARRFEADLYADVVVRQVVPEVARLHPGIAKARHLGIGGSSYGAVAALHAAIRHPRAFDRLLIESAPLWVGGGRLIEAARAARVPDRIWLGVGTRESRRPARSAELVALTRRLGRALDGRTALKLVVAREAGHHESAWAERLPDALRWLFPAS